MSIIGAPSEWANLIDPMVSQILQLVISTWENIPAPASDAREDDITNALCRALRDNRTARSLMLQIDTQQVELDPMPGEDLGRLDIAFRPLVPREDIYFCLECKRLNVVVNGKMRAYAAEYVTSGMLRFVTGQYARAVRHGGMLAYVLDGNVAGAIANVEGNLRNQQVVLCMAAPGEFQPSSIIPKDSRIKETHHQRAHDTIMFRIHHVFVARRADLGS
ncbi:MAG: hypothetical protein ABSH08_01085 [Tepidisphaeraceae bacterium]